MRLKAILTLFAVYAVTAVPVCMPGGWRVIVQPAADDAVEVYYALRPSAPRFAVSIGPFYQAIQVAQQRAEAYPHDLAPPYLLYTPYRLVAPYVTPRGQELASQAISGVDQSHGKPTPYRIVPQVRSVRNSQAALTTLTEDTQHRRPIDEREVLAMYIEPELNRIVVETTTFSQELRRRLAKRYGGLVTMDWDPLRQPMQLL
ncbi:hypothetical protein [Nonomuraea rhodomycinica]|uniref:Uncharacterized protein n=1 Tax=Nonomuraea rhodomycinica TaxID=1712872 RepID=A0A7Y6IYF7_9ACTN|nr:hypothetical protein [Nonomuraea rhodomycinica]NUW46318.1 hypothetical protein [Nonomuraea rhodomycinica]